jgi:hypothetical protein
MWKHEIFKIACGERSAVACEIEYISKEHAFMARILHAEA